MIWVRTLHWTGDCYVAVWRWMTRAAVALLKHPMHVAVICSGVGSGVLPPFPAGDLPPTPIRPGAPLIEVQPGVIAYGPGFYAPEGGAPVGGAPVPAPEPSGLLVFGSGVVVLLFVRCQSAARRQPSGVCSR